LSPIERTLKRLTADRSTNGKKITANPKVPPQSTRKSMGFSFLMPVERQ